MKIDVRCFKCTELNKVELNEEFKFKYVCSSCGEEEESQLSLEKYQVLFDLGIICLKNGYYKEAVADFAAALERCFEYSIRVILNKNKIDNDRIDTLWKEIRNQSERQFGAFVALYMREFNKVFKLDTKQSGFRNDVIHKGKIPTFKDTYKYAEYVYNNIYSILGELATSDYDGYIYNYIISPKKDDDYNKGVYVSFINTTSFFEIVDGKAILNVKIPNFASVYDEFYKDNQLIVPMG
jgi:hypothetical protein